MTLRSNPNADGKRHGSSGAESQRSIETVRAPIPSFSASRFTSPLKVQAHRQLHRKESEISPSTMLSQSTPTNARQDIAPWEGHESPERRSEESQVHSFGRQTQSSSTRSYPQWLDNKKLPAMPTSIFDDGMYNDSNENLEQISPGFAPGHGMGFPDDAEHRRPSTASATTISSTGSKVSMRGRVHKKLQGIFGDEFPGLEEANSRQNSETSSMQGGGLSAYLPGILSRERNNSLNDAMKRSRPPSPEQSRPRTPAPPPSSEVTPWVFQDPESAHSTTDSFFPHDASNGRATRGPSSSRLHLPGHRQNRSVEEKQGSIGFPLRPTTSREQSSSILRRENLPSAMSSALNLRSHRSTSPSPSTNSTITSTAGLLSSQHRSPNSIAPKRSLFDRVTGRHKNDKLAVDPPQTQTATTLNPLPVRPREHGRSFSKQAVKTKTDPLNGVAPRKESRLPFKNKRYDTGLDVLKTTKDPNEEDTEDNAAQFYLDTDTTNMEGIVDHRRPPMTPPAGEQYSGWPMEQPTPLEAPSDETGAWDAPESWLTNKNKVQEDTIRRLAEVDDDPDIATDEDPGPVYFMRIMRADSTFAVICASLNTTAAELISMMAKKTFLQDELDKYQIVMRKQDTSRQLAPDEKPLVIQNKLLKMAGYDKSDGLDDLGRDDHGYLCRFTFLPSKMSGYSSLERDPGLNSNNKFTHIDLAGRNLVTIPIALYKKASEINTLNLSRNLTLDIPKDFIQSCSQLREVRYTSNEAARLPASLAFASKLQSLDVSNNRLSDLDHTELNQLQNLLALKLQNNLLKDLPSYFGKYRALRVLNLSSNSLTEFPAALRGLTTLTDLDISFNSLSSLGNVGTLTNLERLWATNNNLAGPFDESVKSLTSLREIDARFNAITNIDVVSQLPRLEALTLGHNSISQFAGSFHCLKMLMLNHNPVTNFDLASPVPSLSVLNLASAKLSQLPDALFMKMSGLTKLTISKNHFVSLSPHFGLLSKLEYLSIYKNELSRLPPEIGRLTELRYLDARENNLSILPPEIWLARKLETLNVSSNVLAEFPKPGAPLPPLPDASTMPPPTPAANSGPMFEELGSLEDFQLRRPSQASGGMGSSTGSPGTTSRKGSLSSAAPAKPAALGRMSTASTTSTITPASRKDSTLSNRLATTFSSSLRHLFLADNRLEDDVFNELVLLPELRILNLSYNQLYDVPPRTIRKWTNLTELYLSGNDLTSIPSEDLEESSVLKVLHINNNKFQNLPAELGNLHRLAILDVGNNMLKYNVCNYPYDWNWNSNPQLRYLNLSGNKRLEIKPSGGAANSRDNRDLTDFSALASLRVLGLMDVTLMIPSVPDGTPDRRVRLAGSVIGTSMPYGMADTLGRNEHLSMLDMMVPRFRGHEDESLVGLFDGQTSSSGGSRVAKFLHEEFNATFVKELEKIKGKEGESPLDALRRTYLRLNRELATAATQAMDAREHPSSAIVHRGSVSGPELADSDICSGSVATVLYMRGMELYVSNVGDAQALLINSESGYSTITRKHDPAEEGEDGERARIRAAGGYVSRQGKLNDQLDVSRAFGYVQMAPCVIAAPHVARIELKDTDEIILLASRELWDYLTPDFAVDVARQERSDLMRAAQRLRDIAIAFGATGKIMVLLIGVSDLRKRERLARYRTSSMTMGGAGGGMGSTPEDYFGHVRKGKRGRDMVGDSKLARLKEEVDAPTGEVTLVFTDIKNSTILWETYPVAMQSAIKMHNEVMRRQLRLIGGYEVKTEGDAFMVAFPTVTSALLWCFTIQSQLLEVEWPQEILSSVHGEEMRDADNNLIFRGLSVRMGIHWGRPVCEIDPVTKRMDYFGPMVNRAARIESVADGGQICVSSDFIQELQRMLETHIESDRSGSTGSEDTLNEDLLEKTIRRELRTLSSQGFEVKDLGQRTLKGLENPEYIHLMYPHSLASRLIVQQQKAEAESRAHLGTDGDAKRTRNSQLTIDTDNVWDLWNVSLRLEMLCSTLENTGARALKAPDTALIERMKHGGGEITDRFLINLVEHQISRIETCISTLELRNMLRPFKDGMLNQACPMADIFSELTSQISELKMLKARSAHD